MCSFSILIMKPNIVSLFYQTRLSLLYYRYVSGADLGFSLGGGGGGGGVKDYVPSRTLRAQNRTHFQHGSRALEALLF